MAGGIIPVSQPIDNLISKFCKGQYQEKCDFYMPTAPQNEKGQPMPPSRQLCAQWVVMSWGTVSEELIKKA